LNNSMNNDQISHLVKTIPVGRIASVDEQVKPIVFLCSGSADYITGACLDVNGGLL